MREKKRKSTDFYIEEKESGRPRYYMGCRCIVWTKITNFLIMIGKSSRDGRMKRLILKKVRNHLILLLGGALAGVLLLLAVYCLPTAPVQEHINDSLPMLEREFLESSLLSGYPGSFVGNFTDCLMLHHSIYRSEKHTMLDQVLRMYRSESGTGEGWAPGTSLVDYLEGVEQFREEEYARYWHGYLIFLKPMFLVTSLGSIRIFQSVVQLTLLGLILLSCGRRGEKFLGTAFLVTVPFLYFFSLYNSLSLSICFYLMSGGVLLQLRYNERLIERGIYGEFFMVMGMLTCYFDFLTYPLVTLGIPLCVSLYLNSHSAKEAGKSLFINSAEWSIGYLGLWVLKWTIVDLLYGTDTIGDGIRTLFERTAVAEEQTSRLSGFLAVLKSNMSVYINWGFILLAAGIFLWILGRLYRERKRITLASFQTAIVIWIVALYPFVWFFLTQNHSEEHWMFTYKIFSVSVFAGICGVGKLRGGDQ